VYSQHGVLGSRSCLSPFCLAAVRGAGRIQKMTSETFLRVSAPDSHYAIVHYMCSRNIRSTSSENLRIACAVRQRTPHAVPSSFVPPHCDKHRFTCHLISLKLRRHVLACSNGCTRPQRLFRARDRMAWSTKHGGFGAPKVRGGRLERHGRSQQRAKAECGDIVKQVHTRL
jgi:hypothetical protein